MAEDEDELWMFEEDTELEGIARPAGACVYSASNDVSKNIQDGTGNEPGGKGGVGCRSRWASHPRRTWGGCPSVK